MALSIKKLGTSLQRGQSKDLPSVVNDDGLLPMPSAPRQKKKKKLPKYTTSLRFLHRE